MYKNSNASKLSSKQLFAQSVNNGTYTTVQIGKPFNVQILNITSVEATLLYEVVGRPKFSIIELTNVNTSTVYTFSNVNISYQFTGLIPANNYKVSITSFYACNDSFILSTPILFTTTNEAAVTDITVQLPMNQLYLPNFSSETYLDVSFNSSIGNPTYYTVDISGIYSGNIVANSFVYESRINNLIRNTQYKIKITTFYLSTNYFIEKTQFTLNETPVSNITILQRRGNYIDISFTKVGFEDIIYIVYANGIRTETTFGKSDLIYRIPNLSPNTSYIFQLGTYYPNTKNIYLSDSIGSVTTNENTITNIIASVDKFNASFSFTKSPGEVVAYIVTVFQENRIIRSSNLQNSSTIYVISELNINSEYILYISSVYTDISYTIPYPFKTLYEGNPDISNATFILGTSAVINWRPYKNGNYASEPSFYSVYLNGIVYISTINTNITFTNLIPNANYQVYVTSTYNSSNQYTSSSVSFTTLNEGPVQDVTFTQVTGNQIKIIVDTSNSFLPIPSSYELIVNGNSAIISSGISAFSYSNLTYNTLYDVTLKTFFYDVSYTYSTFIQTKNERRIDLYDNDFTITGNSITMRVNLSQNVAFRNYFIICSSLLTTQNFSTNVTTWLFKDLKPNENHDITIYANTDDTSYVSHYTKQTLNESSVGYVNGNVFNNKAVIYFSDSSGTGVSYDISITPSIKMVPINIHPFNEITLSDLSIDTQYSVTLNSIYSSNRYNKTISFQTLNQNKPTDIVTQSTSTVLTIDISFQNVVDISFASIQLLDLSANEQETIKLDVLQLPKDIDVFQGRSYIGNVLCIYKDQVNSPTDLLYGKNNTYISDNFSFNSSIFQSTAVLINGSFKVANPPEEEPRGFFPIVPDYWNNSIYTYIIKNQPVIGSSIFYKKNPDSDVSNHAIIYRPNASTQLGFLQHDLSRFLFKGYYKISFYVTNLFESGLTYDNNGDTSSDIEFQVRIDSGDLTIYQSGLIIKADISWSNIQLNIDIARSYKFVKFYITRTKLEKNSLCISDVSMISVNSFSNRAKIYPSTEEISWSIPNISGTWNQIWSTPYTPLLISNMSISFWLYIHDVSFSLLKTVLFLIGDSIEKAKMIIYFDSNTNLFLTDSSLNLTQKIPIHITIVYSNQNITFFKNGTFIITFSNILLSEPLGSDTFYRYSPSVSTLGYITKQFKFFDYSLPPSDILSSIQSEKNNIGNLSDFSSNRIPINITTTGNIDISYQLYNSTNFLLKKLNYFSSNHIIGSIENSSNITCAFWIQTTGIISKRIFDLSFCYSDIFNNQLYFKEELIFTLQPNKWYHFTWTLSNQMSRFYLNGYLYKQLTTTFLVKNFNRLSIGNTNINVGDFKLYNTNLSELNALTIFHSHYFLEPFLSNAAPNIYIINLNIPIGGALKNTENGNVDLSYNIIIANDLFRSGNFQNNATTSSIEFNSIQLNEYRQSPSELTVELPQLGISKIYSIVGPYITFDYSNFDEGNTVIINLQNVDTNIYSYDISGVGITLSDFSGNQLSGNISRQTPLALTIRNDFATEGSESFIFSIPSLKISKTATINDLSVDLSFTVLSRSVSFGNEASIVLNIPTRASTTRFYYIITGISNDDISINGTNYNNNISNYFAYDFSNIIFSVKTNILKILTLSLRDYSYNVILKLNDVTKAILTKSPLLNYLYEGEKTTITLEAPFSRQENTTYRYIISGTVSQSDLSGVEMSGVLTIDNNFKATQIIEIKNDFKTEGSEKLIFSVYASNENGYNNEPDASLSFDILDSSIASSYILSSDVSSANEGDSFIIYLKTIGVPSNTEIPYLISGVESSDISFVNLSGIFTVDQSGNSFKRFYISKDALTENIEYFKISLTGLAVNVFTEVRINDTSQTPEYTFYSDFEYVIYSSTIETANIFSLWLHTNDTVPDNTIIPYTITGISSEDISGIDLSGKILTTNNELSKTKNTLTGYLRNTLTGYKTLRIVADNYEEISSISIGFNYSVANPHAKFQVAFDSTTSLVNITSIWYGYNNKNIIFSISGDVSGSFVVNTKFEQENVQRTNARSGYYRYYLEDSNDISNDISNGQWSF